VVVAATKRVAAVFQNRQIDYKEERPVIVTLGSKEPKT